MTTPLEEEIRLLIAAEGPMPVGRYMGLCLGHSRHGYYVTRDPLGARGDFTTAPEISQMFGELLGLWAVAAWQQMGAPGLFRLVELGPGRGTLMADALRAARLVPAFGAAARIHLVETSPVLREAQARALVAHEERTGARVSWHARIEDVPAGPAIVLANEFFDALPVDQYVWTGAGWHERRVGVGAQGQLTFGLDAAPSRMAPTLAAHLPLPSPGAVLEVMESGPARALAGRIAAEGGIALAIDYGHAGGHGDTLQALKAHRFADPLADPGEADLTAHVDFARLALLGQEAGLKAFGPLEQGDFLARLGLAARADRLMRDAAPEAAAAIAAAARRLAGTGDGEMGRLFKVLALAHPHLGTPPAFDPSEEFNR